MKYHYLVISLFFFFIKHVTVAQGSTFPKVWLVSVGIDQYKYNHILKKSSYSSIDGSYHFMRAYQTRNLLEFEPTMLFNASASYASIEKSMEKVFVENKNLSADDLVIFYFSGHSISVGNSIGVCPHDFDGSLRSILTKDKILSIVSKSKAKHKLCIIDTVEGELIESLSTAISKTPIEEFNQVRAKSGTSLIYIESVNKNNVYTIGAGNNGCLNNFIIRGLAGEANINDDAIITITELFTFIKKSIQDLDCSKSFSINVGNYDPSTPIMIIPKQLNLTDRFFYDPTDRIDLERANILFQAGNYQESFLLFKAHTTSSYFTPEMQIRLGKMYTKGLGTLRNRERGRHWYQKAALTGSSSGQYNYAQQLESSGDYSSAIEWYERAAKQNHPFAQLALGIIFYGEGERFGIPKNYSLAFQYFKKSAEQEVFPAQVLLSNMYTLGQGVIRNPAMAFELLMNAQANKMDDISPRDQLIDMVELNLAFFYLRGIVVKIDIAKAIEYFQRSADKGNAEAMYQLGLIYEYGNGVRKNVPKAIQWYSKAARIDHKSALSALKKLE